MSTRPVRLLTRIGLASMVVLALTACPEDAADIVEVKGTALDFPVAPLGTISFPGGFLTVENLTLASFDTTVSDAFQRSVAGNDPFYSSTARGDAADGTDFGPGWNFATFERNSTTDPRLPALTEDDVTLPAADGFVIGDPAEVGAPGFHNPFTEGSFSGLQPNTTYIVAFFRFGTQINGDLDQAEQLLGEAVADPDQLVAVGGTPKGDPSVPIVSFPTVIPFQSDANPYVLGQFTTDGSGQGFFDVVIDGSGGELYQTTSGDPSDSDFDLSLVARNDDTSTSFPRYNYLVILEGPAVDAADAADNPQAVRIQIGQDFEAGSGAPINNGYGPFPGAALTTDALIALPAGAGRPDSVSVELTNLERLASGSVWQAWLVNRDESPPTMAAAVGTYERIAVLRELDPITGEILSEADSVVGTTPGTSSFRGELRTDVPDAENRVDPAEVKHRITVSDASVSGEAMGVGFFTDLVLTTEEGGEATTPSEAKALWFQFTDQGGTPNDFSDDASSSGALFFGNFNPMDPAASRVVTSGEYAQSTGALGGILSEGSTVTAVSVDLRNLPLPPRGFFYEGWIMNAETGETMSMGPLTALPPKDGESLFDVDMSTDFPGVTPSGIRFSNTFLEVDPGMIVSQSGEDFTVNFTTYFLTLEPKIGVAAKNVTDIQTGPLPVATIIDRRE